MRKEGGVPRVLLAQRPAGKPLAGLWEFPGGKLDAGESPEECLIRELKEELEISVHFSNLQAITFASHPLDEEKHLLMPLWRITDFDGEPIGAEGQQLTWVKADELTSYEMPPADLPLIMPVQRELASLL